jgi:DNA-binding transcriptional LysR family regulator
VRHRLAGKRSVSLASLEDELFVDFPEDWGIRIAIDRAFASAEVHRRSAFVINDASTMMRLVAEGLGVALLPQSVAEPLPRVRFVSLRKPAPVWDLAVAVADGDHLSRAARELVAMIVPGYGSNTIRAAT